MADPLVGKFNNYEEDGYIKYEPRNYILDNLAPFITLRDYQERALARFEYYMERFRNRQYPTHLLFHMATGSGKTVVMAANILYLYKKGYRNFLFFVDKKNVIEKTRANFLDKSSSKYLFSDKIVIDGVPVAINEVDNFDSSNPDSINIIFTTMGGLHSQIKTPRENSIILEELKYEKIVLLSDEAHHINAATKKQSKLNKTEKKQLSWENTVDTIFSINQENIMLAYTATIELDHPAVAEKYADKIIYQYDLKSFYQDQYSKQIKLLQSDVDRKTRIYQAMILSQYRRKVAEKHGLFIKPCLLIKSPKISDSEDAYKEFHESLKQLNSKDLEKIRKKSGSSIINRAFDYFQRNEITLSNLVKELKEDFRVERTIVINSKSDSEEKQKQLLVNSLESPENELRAIFVVDMLNEGWDVLNLFDIVRIDESQGKKKATISEAQLIGRGARYFPFQLDDDQSKYKRKFDDDPYNELSCLEELYYHSINRTSYITKLKKALEEMGLPTDTKKEEAILHVKEEVKKSTFYRDTYVFENKKIKRNKKQINSFADIFGQISGSHDVGSNELIDSRFFLDDKEHEIDKKDRYYSVKQLGLKVCRKAIDKNKYFRFNNLKFLFPNLKSMKEFLESPAYCRNLRVKITGSKDRINNLSQDDKLIAAINLFNDIQKVLEDNSSEYTGTKKFFGKPLSTVLVDKIHRYTEGVGQTSQSIINNKQQSISLDVSIKSWFVFDDNYGTDEEKSLIRFIDSVIDDLEKKYKNIYLLQNIKFIKLYDFQKGRGFEPDFILFVEEKTSGKALNYQLFIEPKGPQLLEHDKWKQNFLKQITAQYEITSELEGLSYDSKDYKLVGLPFYTEDRNKQDFIMDFKDNLKI